MTALAGRAPTARPAAGWPPPGTCRRCLAFQADPPAVLCPQCVAELQTDAEVAADHVRSTAASWWASPAARGVPCRPAVLEALAVGAAALTDARRHLADLADHHHPDQEEP